MTNDRITAAIERARWSISEVKKRHISDPECIVDLTNAIDDTLRAIEYSDLTRKLDDV